MVIYIINILYRLPIKVNDIVNYKNDFLLLVRNKTLNTVRNLKINIEEA